MQLVNICCYYRDTNNNNDLLHQETSTCILRSSEKLGLYLKISNKQNGVAQNETPSGNNVQKHCNNCDAYSSPCREQVRVRQVAAAATCRAPEVLPVGTSSKNKDQFSCPDTAQRFLTVVRTILENLALFLFSLKAQKLEI